jgi:hypothetical protein
MSIPDVTSLISTSATWVTALLVLFTLVEMKRQRRLAYSPKLIVLGGFRYSYPNPQEPEEYPIHWGSEKSDPMATSARVQRLSAELLNVGLGGAVNIRAKWTFDSTNLVNLLNSVRSNESPLYELQRDVASNWDTLYQNGSKSVVLNRTHDAVEFDAVLPAANNRITSLNLPPAFTDILGRYIYEGYTNDTLGDPVILDLRLDYKDIAGNKFVYEDTFTVQIVTILKRVDNMTEYVIEIVSSKNG